MQIKRIALNAVMIAVYVVLSMLVIPMGGLKITFEHFPVVLCAILFGPVDAILVGFAGELFNQLWSFGMTPTTLLWILPIVSRGLIVGVCAKVCKKSMSKSVIVEHTVPIFFYVVCILSGVISSLFNTFALYVDSKMFGYYSYAMVFGALAVRILLSIVTSIVIGIAIKPILHAIKHTNLR
jgi:ECF transporter S component (folate family)